MNLDAPGTGKSLHNFLRGSKQQEHGYGHIRTAPGFCIEVRTSPISAGAFLTTPLVIPFEASVLHSITV